MRVLINAVVSVGVVTSGVSIAAAADPVTVVATVAAPEAQAAPAWFLRNTLTISSNNVARGFSLTSPVGAQFAPSVIGLATIGRVGGVFAAVRASNINILPGGPGAEFDLIAGIAPIVGGRTVSIGYGRYFFTNGNPSLGEFFFQVPAPPLGLAQKMGWPETEFTPTFSAFWNPAVGSVFLEGGGELILSQLDRLWRITAIGAVGYFFGPNYLTWNAGLRLSRGNVGIEFRYHDTNVANPLFTLSLIIDQFRSPIMAVR